MASTTKDTSGPAISTTKIEEFEPTGGAADKDRQRRRTGSPCRVRFDLSTNDMFVPQYSGQGAVRYTAASGYAAGLRPGLRYHDERNVAINATRHVVYIAGSRRSRLTTPPRAPFWRPSAKTGCNIGGIAVDDATDTVFLSRTCTERSRNGKSLVPEAVTGDPTGNSQVSGSVALAGGGEVTSCKFEFGETTEYGQADPAPQRPHLHSDQALLTAELKDDLEGEKTYHYRLVASNANGAARGVDKTITPHNVKLLATGPPPNDRHSALVTGTFEGNGEHTTYWFEWRTTSYGHQIPMPPGSDAGAPTGRQKSRPN